MKEEEILALLRLQKTPSIGDILAKKLIATVGNAADIFTENKNTLLNMLSTKTNNLANTQILKTKIEKLSVDGTIDIGTLTKDKTIGTLLHQLFKDIMGGVRTKG